jgi:hypothetical protein
MSLTPLAQGNARFIEPHCRPLSGPCEQESAVVVQLGGVVAGMLLFGRSGRWDCSWER